MKLASTLATVALTFATVSFAGPMPDESVALKQRDNELFARKSCSGSRTRSDTCSGKRLRPQHSWHNWYVASETRTPGVSSHCARL